MKEDTTNSSEQEKINNILTASDYYNRACKREALRDYEGAAKEYEKMIELEPENLKYYFEQGILYYKDGNYLLSLVSFQHLADREPKHKEVYLYIGLIYSNLYLYPEAKLRFNKAIKINPDFLDAYVERGILKTKMKYYSSAIKDFNKAIKINPNLSKSYYGLSEAKKLIGDEKGTTIALSKGFETFSNYFDNSMEFVFENIQSKRYKSTIVLCSNLIISNPNRFDLYFLRGESYSELKEYTEAITDFDTIINQDPLHVIAFLKRGSAKLKLKDRQGAFADFKKALELDAEYFEFYFEKLSSELDAEEFAEEMKFFIRNFKAA